MDLKNLRYFALFLLIPLFLCSIVFAGTTGKIAGIVVDKDNGDPLIGVNITVEGTLMGAASDIDGTYSILQVPPGTFNLVVEYVGYAKTKIEFEYFAV